MRSTADQLETAMKSIVNGNDLWLFMIIWVATAAAHCYQLGGSITARHIQFAYQFRFAYLVASADRFQLTSGLSSPRRVSNQSNSLEVETRFIAAREMAPPSPPMQLHRQSMANQSGRFHRALGQFERADRKSARCPWSVGTAPHLHNTCFSGPIPRRKIRLVRQAPARWCCTPHPNIAIAIDWNVLFRFHYEKGCWIWFIFGETFSDWRKLKAAGKPWNAVTDAPRQLSSVSYLMTLNRAFPIRGKCHGVGPRGVATSQFHW